MPDIAHSIDLNLRQKLQDKRYRLKFFWAESSAQIAEALIALRKRRGLNQTQVAELTGTKQPAISRVEQADYQNWNIKTLRTIAEALDARVRVLIQPSEDVLKEYDSDVNADSEIDSNANSIQPDAVVDLNIFISGKNTISAQQNYFNQEALSRSTALTNFSITAIDMLWKGYLPPANSGMLFSAEPEEIKLRRRIAQLRKIIVDKDKEIAALRKLRSESSTLEPAERPPLSLGQSQGAPIGILYQ